jgi:hypothetical protein
MARCSGAAKPARRSDWTVVVTIIDVSGSPFSVPSLKKGAISCSFPE